MYIKKSSKIFLLLFVLTLIFAASFTVFASAVTPRTVRTLPLGTEVTVTGYAASAHCNDYTGFDGEFYLYGGTNGICVKIPKNEKISLYENLEVKGTLIKENDELKIESSEITRKEGSGTKLFKRISIDEANDYDAWGGSFVRLTGTVNEMYTDGGVIFTFNLTDGNDSIPVIIEKGVLSFSTGLTYKNELTEMLKYKREVVVDGFVAHINGRTVIRVKDCDDIDVKYHACKFGEAVTEKEPSCGISGLSVKSCFCGKRQETVLPALQHSFKDTVEIKPTCANEGLSVRTCKNCSYRLETFITKTQHNYRETTEKKASCVNEGIYVRYCTGCTFREETVVPKTEHSFKEKTEKKASCTENGIFVKYCTNCTFREETVIPQAEHKLKESTQKKATCTEKGIAVQKCSDCSYEIKREIPMLPHEYEAVTEKASFNKSGKIFDRCKNCRDEKNITVIPAVTKWELSQNTFVYDGKKHNPKITLTDENGKTVTSFSLAYSDGSELGKHKITLELSENYTGKKTFTYSIIPDDTKDISHSVSGKNVTLTFSPVEFADGYRIYYYSGGSLTSLKTAEVAECTVTLPRYNSTYTLVIKAYTKTADGYMWSKGSEFLLKTAPEKVTGIKTDSDYCSVRVSWNKSEGADGYRVYIRKDGEKFKKVATLKGTSYEITGLTASTNYTVAVKPYSRYESINLWGEPVYKAVSTPSGKVTSFTAKESYYSVALSWRSVKNADGYRLYIYNSKKKKYTTVSRPTDNTFTVEDLNSGTTYRFAVRPYTVKSGKTYLGESVYLTVTTKLKKPVLVASSKGTKGNSLSWNKINGASGYEVYYCYTKDGKFKKLTTLSARTLMHSKVKKTCYYKVRAYKTVDGKKLYSSFSTVKKVLR